MVKNINFGVMPKPSTQVQVSELIAQIQAGKSRAFALGKFCKKWEISRTTFDRYWKIANDQLAELHKKAKEQADKVYIETAGELAKDAMMSEAEAKKNITDMARGNLADYMVVKRVERRKRIEVGLQTIIDDIKAKIDFEEEFSVLAGFTGDELDMHLAMQANRKREVLRYELELSKNPSATKIIDGPTYWEDVAELDLVRIVQDKVQGKIKSLKHTEHGVQVEMYSADVANVNILKLHGSFEKDNSQKAQTSNQMTDAQFLELLNVAREVATSTGK